LPEQRGLPYLVVVAGGPGLPPMPGVPPRAGVARLQGRAAAARAVGRGWLRLQERGERWPAVTSALVPESVRGLQGSGWVPTWGVEGFGEHKSVQDPGRGRSAGAAGWELQWWPHHVLWWLLGAKDSLASPGRNVGAPCVPSRPKRLLRWWWGGRGLRGAGMPPACYRWLWRAVGASAFGFQEYFSGGRRTSGFRRAVCGPSCIRSLLVPPGKCICACCVWC